MEPTILNDIREKSEKIEEFLPLIGELKLKLIKKKQISGEVIRKQMKELHQFIDSWEQRFLDTTNETIDEKIENLESQEKSLRILKKQTKTFLNTSRRLTLKECKLLGISTLEDDDDESSLTLEDTEDEEFTEIRTMFENLEQLKFPLRPTGVKPEEVVADVESEVSYLLDEANKSLKRTLTNIGGILRGYHRRGQNNDKWVQELRRLEARFETDTVTGEGAPSLSSLLQISEVENKTARNAKQVWKVISDMFHSTDGTMRDGLCKQLHPLYEQFPSEVEFYLCQLINMLLHNKNFKALEDFLFSKCRQSQHFAVQTYFLIVSMGDHGSTRWTNKCKKLLAKLEAAIPADEKSKEKQQQQLGAATASGVAAVTESPPGELVVPHTPDKEEKKNNQEQEAAAASAGGAGFPGANGSGGAEHDSASKQRKPLSRAIRRAGKDYFFSSINFMKELIAISQKLTLKFSQPEIHSTELQKQLESLRKFMEEMLAYLPNTSNSRHLVLRTLDEYCYPIPTFGRVLYYLMLEVVAIPNSIISPSGVKEYMQTLEKTAAFTPEWGDTPDSYGPFGEPFLQKCKRLRTSSPFGQYLGWDTVAYIVKQGDFVLQEQFVIQMLTQFQRIFDKERVPLRLRIYRILALSSDSGLIEVVPNALSIDKLKQQTEGAILKNFFKEQWPDKADYNKATTNFVQSLAAYSLVCYFLQIKDRHNGNIMMDAFGNLLHIDFGYLLSRTVEFEKAPFKLTEEFIDVIGGEKSKLFARYEDLCIQGFFAIRKHYRKILTLVEMTLTQPIMGSQFLPCLEKESVLKSLRKRFHLEDNTKIDVLVKDLIRESRDNWRTNIYDAYQNILQGIRC